MTAAGSDGDGLLRKRRFDPGGAALLWIRASGNRLGGIEGPVDGSVFHQ